MSGLRLVGACFKRHLVRVEAAREIVSSDSCRGRR